MILIDCLLLISFRSRIFHLYKESPFPMKGRSILRATQPVGSGRLLLLDSFKAWNSSCVYCKY